jgi:hypothetical protein
MAGQTPLRPPRTTGDPLTDYASLIEYLWSFYRAVVATYATKDALTLAAGGLSNGLGTLGSSLDANNATLQQTVTLLNTVETVVAGLTASYRTILEISGSHTAAQVAGTYLASTVVPLLGNGGSTVYPLAVITIAAADYPVVGTIVPKFRIRATVSTNDTAPASNFTFGLYPLTRPASAGGAAACIYTVGAVIVGSNGATFSAPAAKSTLDAVGADFDIPADGDYVIGVVTTGTIAALAHVHVNAQLQMRNQ